MKVTIGLPFFNAEHGLADAIRSVFAQTHTDWELILVNDGSTDHSLEIAQSVKDERVRVISDGFNTRLAARLNQIADLAQSDIIARMDADDLMSPERIERQLAILSSEKDIQLVSTGLVSIDENDTPVGIRSHFDDTALREHLLKKKGAGIVHASVMGRREWFLLNRYDPSVPIAQDYDLWLRASIESEIPIRVLREPLYYVRELGSVTASKMFRAYSMDRRAVWLNRRNLWEARFILKSYLKTLALHGIVISGNLDWLTRQRSQRISDEGVSTKVYSDIEKIRCTHVPGL